MFLWRCGYVRMLQVTELGVINKLNQAKLFKRRRYSICVLLSLNHMPSMPSRAVDCWESATG